MEEIISSLCADVRYLNFNKATIIQNASEKSHTFIKHSFDATSFPEMNNIVIKQTIEQNYCN